MTPDGSGADARGDCEAMPSDEERRRLALENLPDDGAVNALAETFRSLSDPTLLRMLAALSKQELCMCDLAKILGSTGSAVAELLRPFRNAGLLKSRREGKVAYYRLDDEPLGSLLEARLWRHAPYDSPDHSGTTPTNDEAINRAEY